jgi:uncharacterized membrane protein (UPF0127 family)
MPSAGFMSAEPAMSAPAHARLLRIQSPAGTELCDRCELAGTPLRRMRGLLGRRSLQPGEGMLIRPANAIHMWFMRFAIDAVFLDSEARVLRIARDLRPWRMAMRRGAKAVLELPAGTCERASLREGDRLGLTAVETAR